MSIFDITFLRVNCQERVAICKVGKLQILFSIIFTLFYPYPVGRISLCLGVTGSRGYLKPRFCSFHTVQYSSVHTATVRCTTTALHCTILPCTFHSVHFPTLSPTTTARQVLFATKTLQRTTVRVCRTVLYRCRTYRDSRFSLTPTLGRWLISIPSHTRLDQALPAPRFLPTKPVTLHIVYTSPRSS